MIAFKVRAKIVEDKSGVYTELPVIWTDQGDIRSITEYLILIHTNGASLSKINKTITALLLLIEFMEANKELYTDPKKLFESFVRRLYSGTINLDGTDPSGLYWNPKSDAVVKDHILRITEFSDWQSENNQGVVLNELRKASSHEERLAYAAWYKKNQNSFLGHIKDTSINKTAQTVLKLRGKSPFKSNEEAVGFPDSQFYNFLINGIGKAPNHRVALRDQLIVLLMHGAGFRASEALTLWVTDVYEDPTDPSRALVRIYDEVNGVAPEKGLKAKGRYTRKEFLKERYGIVPRQEQTGSSHLGWKSKVVDHSDGYIEALWFPAFSAKEGNEYFIECDKLFLTLWREYSTYRAAASCHHPYAFISFEKNSFGKPLTYDSFKKRYDKKLTDLGFTAGKKDGLSPHGHRHSFGRRLEREVGNQQIIKKALHHSSLASQEVYTIPTLNQVNKDLNLASDRLRNRLAINAKELPEWSELSACLESKDSRRKK